MPLLPNTQAILNEIQALITAAGVYTTVEIGAIKDWTNQTPCCEIMFIEDDSEHFAHGGKIRDSQGFRVTTGIDFTTQAPRAAVSQLITIRDTIIPIFQQRALLTGIPGVQDSRVKPGSVRISFMIVNQQQDYLVHEFIVEVRQTYNVPIGGANY